MDGWILLPIRWGVKKNFSSSEGNQSQPKWPCGKEGCTALGLLSTGSRELVFVGNSGNLPSYTYSNWTEQLFCLTGPFSGEQYHRPTSINAGADRPLQRRETVPHNFSISIR